jgi:hypothetical protein
MREFSNAEQRIIDKLLANSGIRFKNLFSDSILNRSRIEIDKDGKIDIYTSDGKDWESIIQEMNILVNLIRYLLNNQLIYAYSNEVILPKYSASIGSFSGGGHHTLSYPYNRKLLARIIIRHQDNLFNAYEPLRRLSQDSFILKDEMRHRQNFRLTFLAIAVAFVASIAPIFYDYFFKADEKRIMENKYLELDVRLKQIENRYDDSAKLSL